VRSTMSQRMHVIERREVELELRPAVDAAATAVAHRGSLDRSLLMPRRDFLGPAADARRAWEGDTVEVPAS